MNIIISNPQKAETFASLFQHIKLFTDNINITFSDERMYIQSMDSAHVSVFEIKIPSAWFDVYEQTHTGDITIGISSSILFKILNIRDKAQQININFDVENDDKLYLHFECENKTIFDRHFEIPLVDLECVLLSIPDTECNAEFIISSSNFAGMIHQLKLFGDNLDVSCNEESIVLSSNSVDAGKMSIDIGIDELEEFSINESETINLSFSLTMLNNICAFNKIAKDIEIKLINNYPMKITYRLGTPDTTVVFYLAPKIDE